MGMKLPPKLSWVILLLLALSFSFERAVAQISVGPLGLAPVTFDTLPLATLWSTRTIVGASGDITTVAQLDAQVQTNSAALITNSLVSSAGSPPVVNGNGSGVWASDGRFIQTRPNANRFTMIMATLRNDSGTNLSSIIISYGLTNLLPVAEQILGNSLYFSLTGTTGSWQKVIALSGLSTSGTVGTNLTLGNWAVSSNLFLLWADDNGSGAPDTAVVMDNFVLSFPFPAITNQPQDTSVAPGQPVSLSVVASGTPPFFYQWRRDGTNISGATNQTLAFAAAQFEDSGLYSVVVSNAFGVAISSNAQLVVACLTPVTINSQPQDWVLQSGAVLSLGVGADGTQPLLYQWYRSGVALAGATNQTYLRTNASSSDSGIYSVVVANCLGSRNSSNVVVSVADPPYALIGMTNYFWRYDQSGACLDNTSWKATNYNDTAWSLGRGLFAVEDNAALTPLINTFLSLFDASSTHITTYYFRTQFVLTNDLNAVVLVASNYVDDGAVYYLNGQEKFRINVLAGVPACSDLAPGTLPESVFVVSNLSSSLFVAGTNTLAVEVHQVSTASSDVAFGMALLVIPQAPALLRITNEPADLIIAEQQPASFTVGLGGLTGHYQWFKDGVAVPGATSLTLSFSSALVSDAGAYMLVASNAINVVTSRVARLVVLPDTGAPALFSADLIDATHVLVVFSEPLLASGVTNPALYSVTNTFGAVVGISKAVLTNGTNVWLTTSPLAPDANYILTAAGIPDGSLQQNLLPLSAVPVARRFTLLPFSAYWQYFDPYPPLEEIDPGANWKELGFDASTWGYDPGAFLYSASGLLSSSVPAMTLLGPTPAYTAYFRATFDVAVSLGGVNLTLRRGANDAGVFYLNGVEVNRYNLPPGTITPMTSASSQLAAGNMDSLLNALLPVASETLHSGTNLFAAELHQIQSGDQEKFLAVELSARAESLLTGPLLWLGGPSDQVVTENQPVTFRISQVAASAFQWQLNGTNFPGATNGTLTLLATMSAQGSQVRCICSNPGGSITTSNATLYVVPDLTRPTLLDAVMNEDGTVTLGFSKLLDAASATSIGNYLLTNAAGGFTTITGATLTNGTNVILSFAAPLQNGATVVVSGVTDQAARPNAVRAGTAARVAAHYFIPFDGAWKYLLINTNETVQSTFMNVGYDDSTWLGPSNGLFYIETAALPGPKNTELSFFDGTGVNRINTYYFRRQLVTPIANTNVTLQLRHIIDDGMVLHLNGQEIYRYSMPAGALTAASQAIASIGDATLMGPFSVSISNLVGGTNVLAIEVHQNGTSSSDIVMGIELDLQIPGGSLPFANPDPLARLSMIPVGNQFLLSWGEQGFTLERAENLNGPWSPIAMTSPAFATSSNSSAFFRLRR